MNISRRSDLAARMQDIQPFHVMDILARARALEAAGHSIIHMEIGEPDASTATPIVDAGIAALQAGHTHYTPALGLPALREAIAAWYAQRYGVQIESQRVVVTSGASGALLLALGVLLNPQDSLLLGDPGYPCNRHFARFIEVGVQSVPVTAETRYQLQARHITQYWNAQTRAALVASPANPTGMLLSAMELRALYAEIAARDGKLIVDEIYHGLTYGCDAATALAVSDEIFVINSFSKYFGMTGWRLGWLIVPSAYVEAVDRLTQNLFLAASTPAQYAALAAFQPQTVEILEQRRAEFQARRDFLLPALRELGFELPLVPEGAFYLYAGCGKFTHDSQQFARDILEQVGVAITPGIDFGSYEANTHVRFAYTTGLPQLEHGVERLRQFLQVGA